MLKNFTLFNSHKLKDFKKYIFLHIIKYNMQLTTDFSQREREKFCNREAMAIRISNCANLIPMQLRGPIPNGMKLNGCRAARASGVCL